MDYGRILNRAWHIVWEHKFLIILGVLVALGSGLGSSTSSGTNLQYTAGSPSTEFGIALPDTWSDAGAWGYSAAWGRNGFGDIWRQASELASVTVPNSTMSKTPRT